jgi:transposase
MAVHYEVGILPARPGKPRDKAKVESGVRFAKSYILGRLRHLTFFLLAECNAKIGTALSRMNERPMRRLGVSRRQLFEAIERPALHQLPATPMFMPSGGWPVWDPTITPRSNSLFYSVPHTLIRQQVDACITAHTIEVFHRGRRVAAHPRRYGGRCHGTDPEHMPSAHRRYAEWTSGRFQHWARTVGPNTEGLIIALLAHRRHPEQGFRICLGLMRLLRGLDPSRAERVAARAVEIGALNYKSIVSILAHNLDRRHAAPAPAAGDTAIVHASIRSPRYFH